MPYVVGQNICLYANICPIPFFFLLRRWKMFLHEKRFGRLKILVKGLQKVRFSVANLQPILNVSDINRSIDVYYVLTKWIIWLAITYYIGELMRNEPLYFKRAKTLNKPFIRFKSLISNSNHYQKASPFYIPHSVCTKLINDKFKINVKVD